MLATAQSTPRYRGSTAWRQKEANLEVLKKEAAEKGTTTKETGK